MYDREKESSIVYECCVCHRQTVSARAATLQADSCCMVCAQEHNGPGKFQQYQSSDPQYFDPEQMGKALILHSWTNDADEYMWAEGWGYCGRFDNILLYEDSQGFVTFEEFDNEDKANKEYESLYLMGWGASEFDIYISHDWPRGWQAYDGDSGKQIEVWARNGHEYDDDKGIDRSRILAAVRLYCTKTGYFPDVWESNERGSLTHIGKDIW